MDFAAGDQMPLSTAYRVPKDAIGLVAAILIWIALAAPALTGGHSFSMFMDNEYFMGPAFAAVSNSYAQGELPLRMGTLTGGLPLYDLAQFSPFYPFYFFGIADFGSPIKSSLAFHQIILLHLFIAQINMYVLLRVLKVSCVAAVMGATLVTFSANSLVYTTWANIVAPYAWFPLYLAGLFGMFREPRSPGYFLTALSAAILLVLASPSQPLIHLAFVTAFFCAFFLVRGENSTIAQRLRVVVLGVGGLGVASVLALSVVLLPVLSEFGSKIRWVGPFPPVLGNDRIPFDAFLYDQLTLDQVGGIFFRTSSNAVGSQYLGVAACALAVVGFLSRPTSWIRAALAVLAAYTLLSSAGSNSGLAYINYHIPLINKIREPGRFLVLFQFAMAMLAAFGIDDIRRAFTRDETGPKLIPVLAGIAFVVVAALVAALLPPQGLAAGLPPLVWVVVPAILLAISFVVGRIKLAQAGLAIGLIWSAAAVVSLWTNVKWEPNSIASTDYVRNRGLGLDQAIARLAALDPNHEYRVLFDGDIDKQRGSMLASYRGVRGLNFYFNPAPRRQFEEMYYHVPRGDRYFSALGAKYLLCQNCTEQATAGFTFLEETNGYKIFVDRTALPKSYVMSSQTGTFVSLGEYVQKLGQQTPGAKVLFVEGGQVLPPRSPAGAPPCSMRRDRHSATRLTYELSCTAAGVLVINEYYDSAWKFSVNGQRIRPLRVNGNQIGIPFAAGQQFIDGTYMPINLLRGLIVSSVMLVLLLASICVVAFTKLQRRRVVEPLAKPLEEVEPQS